MGDREHCGQRWSRDEDVAMREFIAKYYPLDEVDWEAVSRFLNSKRLPHHCKNRWESVIMKGLVKGPWTKVEDATILRCKAEGIVRWKDIAAQVTNRIGKQCRERWDNHLNPELSKAPWTDSEERQVIEAQHRIGNKWTQIAKEIPGRSENDVKNHWNSLAFRRKYPHLEKKRKLSDREMDDNTSRDTDEMVHIDLHCDTNMRSNAHNMCSQVEGSVIYHKQPSYSSFDDFTRRMETDSSATPIDLSRLSSASAFDLTPLSTLSIVCENVGDRDFSMYWDLFAPTPSPLTPMGGHEPTAQKRSM